jgi:hypothetical protein
MKLASVLILALVGTVVSADSEFLRDLQAQPPLVTMNPTTPPSSMNGTKPGPPPKKYDENLKIPFKVDLGCGACIRGDYVYCIPGPEGSNST